MPDAGIDPPTRDRPVSTKESEVIRMRPAYLLGGLAAAIAGCSAHAEADRRAADEPGEVRLRVDRETVQALRTPDRQVYVHGSARLSVVPDVADISIGVTSSRPTAPEALAANNRAMAGLVEAIKARAIASQDIQTSQVSISPQYSQLHAGEQEVSLSVTVSFELKPPR